MLRSICFKCELEKIKKQKNKKQVQFIEVGGVGAGQGLIDYITNNSEVHTRGP